MTIECAFFGFLASDTEVRRTSQAGKRWACLRVGVSKDDDMQWVVAIFGKAAETAAELKKGDRCYCEGSIKLDAWRGNDGVERHGLAVTSFKIDKTPTRSTATSRSASGRSARSRRPLAMSAPTAANIARAVAALA